MKIKSYVDWRKPTKDGKMPVCISVNINGSRFFVNTGLTTTERFDGDIFPKSQSNASLKTRKLGKYLMDVEQYVLVNQDKPISEIKDGLKREILTDKIQKTSRLLVDMIKEYAGTLDKEGTRTIYYRTIEKIISYDRKATIEDVNPEWLNGFRRNLSCELAINTIAIYLRNIKTVFNWCRRRYVTTNDPFLNFKIISEQTKPNNIPVDKLREFVNYPCESWQKPYKDFFLLSLLLAGINPVDLLTCKKDALKDGHITFVRQKTNKQNASSIRPVTLPVYKEALEIINRYPSNEGYLLGFMDSRNTYRSFARECNDALKKIGPSKKVKDKVGKLRKIEYSPLCPDISLYSARYSFGSIAVNDLDISEHAVAMCLGHSWASKNVTAHYISHDQKKIDNTVRKVIDYILCELPRS